MIDPNPTDRPDQTPPADAQQTPDLPVTIVRRTRSSGRFHTRPTPDTTEVVVGRDLLKARRPSTGWTTKRERQIAGDLPDWEPLPPGELHVHRPQR